MCFFKDNHKFVRRGFSIRKSIWLNYHIYIYIYIKSCDHIGSTTDVCRALVSVIKSSSCCNTLPEWGRCKMSNGHWLLHLTHRTSLIFPACSKHEIWGKSPLEIILLPHFVRGSRQLLLYMTDTFAAALLTQSGSSDWVGRAVTKNKWPSATHS